jgi:hypothetical protein
VIAANAPGLNRLQALDYAIRFRAVADDVTQHQHAVDLGKGCEDRLQGLEIAMDVGQ